MSVGLIGLKSMGTICLEIMVQYIALHITACNEMKSTETSSLLQELIENTVPSLKPKPPKIIYCIQRTTSNRHLLIKVANQMQELQSPPPRFNYNLLQENNTMFIGITAKAIF